MVALKTVHEVAIPPEANPDFLVIKLVARIVLTILKQCWWFFSTCFVTILFIYWFYGGLLALALFFFSAAGLIYRASDQLLYHPESPSNSRLYVANPSLVGLRYENVFLKSQDGTKLHAFFVKAPGETLGNEPTVMFLHGNAGNIGHRVPNARGLCTELRCNVLLLEYRGYGLSGGTPSENGLYRDAQAGLDYLLSREDIDKSKLYIFGRSLGGAVAVEIASRAQNSSSICCVLLENTFTSIPAMALHLFPWKPIKYLPRWFHKNKFDSHSKIMRLHPPVVMIAGLKDQLVPPIMMNELFERCGSQSKCLLKIPGGDHNNSWSQPHYYRRLASAIQQVLSSSFQVQENII
uniref:Protein ABHD13 n=1 Tax=Lynceus sp. MCZ IZ 141354 TaxID=1930659 RepID=A0A9N6WZ47_9CRUS|nr:EOG090X09ZU [Lynceus sp. MCZ IZ 141354]